ncbi:kinase-like protein [Aspergillus japonicus CBS 114.51]|uniref:non-specific serine/threonine protein kinase n=1 Tax=Aspergillus japonicus CBS 114.51 TaxID=1448312 RepID=A0A8T8WN20_ASPJA|nr:kinase-like protein [Aspergillus japonicus CBS 114.51]RAH76980.1 kinase-like protein [Aspergillus japonicus CBS 114.51]
MARGRRERRRLTRDATTPGFMQYDPNERGNDETWAIFVVDGQNYIFKLGPLFPCSLLNTERPVAATGITKFGGQRGSVPEGVISSEPRYIEWITKENECATIQGRFDFIQYSSGILWLARDISKFRWQPEETVALKIINSNDGDSALHEREIEKHVSQQNPEHRWGVILRTCLDDFEIPGPQGKHMCLKRFVDRKLPLPIAKAYIYFLLVGLDSLHSECKVVHTDLKLENILLSFENENILTNFVKRQQPRQYKIDGESGRTIYRCCNDFGPLDAKEIKNMVPKISDFGLVTRLDELPSYDGMVGKQLGIYPIQPDYRAPEVILGCG